jgi:hypothetical protein
MKGFQGRCRLYKDFTWYGVLGGTIEQTAWYNSYNFNRN